MPMHYATSTALHQLNQWVRTGERPAVTPRFQFAGSALAKDQYGNTLGGIRMPPVEVPVARYESTTCNLGGITVPFTDQQIQALYPTFDRYQALMKAATDRAVRSGWLLPPDAVDQMRRVCTVQSRYPAADRGTCKKLRAAHVRQQHPAVGGDRVERARHAGSRGSLKESFWPHADRRPKAQSTPA